jgi:hypothetical protein
MAERSKALTAFGRWNIGIADLNPTRGMDVSPRISVLCYTVYGEALPRADIPSKESFQMSKQIPKFRSLNSEPEKSVGLHIEERW